MIVVDASAVAEVVLRRPFAPAIEAVIADSDLRLDTPLLTLDARLAQAARDDGRLVALA